MGPGDQAPPRGPRKALTDWAQAVLGSECRWVWSGHEHGESQVWRGTATGGPCWLKQHTRRDKYARETHALTRWAPALPPVGIATPTVLASSEVHLALILSHVDGSSGDQLAPDRLPGVVQQVGLALRTLHAQDPGPADPMPLSEALGRRAASWAHRARGLVHPSVLDAVLAAASDPASLQHLERVPCHRDCSPRNWLIAEDGRLGLIDFEHARPDPWLCDLLRMEERLFPERPELRACFAEGYGRTPTPDERRTLSALRGLHALSTVAWAHEHADAAFEQAGRASLDRWCADGDGWSGAAG